MSTDYEPEEPIRSHRAPSKGLRIFLVVAIAFFAASVTWSVVHHSTSKTADPTTLSVVDECKLALGYDARTAADIEWLNQCVSALTPPTATPTTPPTVPPSTTSSPSTTPTPSASPTSTPTTTPPTTTPPPSSSGPPSTSPTVSTPPPTSPSPTPTSSGCPVAGRDVPGASDHWGGCWPGPGNTGVPAGTVLSNYTGPCTITVANTVIDSKTVTCSSLLIKTTGVVLKNSVFNGVDVNDDFSGASFMIMDSTVINGARDQCQCVGTRNFVAQRVEVRGGNRSMYCASNCMISNSWLHAQQLQGSQHGSGLREEQGTQASHNALTCDYPIVDDATSLGCSAPLTGYPDFAPIKNNTINQNLFVTAAQGNCSSCDPGKPPFSFCAYGGNTAGKPFSTDPTNATNQKFTNNVFQRGGNNVCGFYGPVTDFSTTRTGNVFSGNVYTDGAPVPVG
jgi:hypothetical protein